MTADANGTYEFVGLPVLQPGQSYTVSIDRAASAKALAGLVPTVSGKGSWTWTATSSGLTEEGQSDMSLNFGFVPAPAPAPAVFVTPTGGSSTTTLPNTGGPSLLWLLSAIALLMAGAAMVLKTRGDGGTGTLMALGKSNDPDSSGGGSTSRVGGRRCRGAENGQAVGSRYALGFRRHRRE